MYGDMWDSELDNVLDLCISDFSMPKKSLGELIKIQGMDPALTGLG